MRKKTDSGPPEKDVKPKKGRFLKDKDKGEGS